MDATLTTDALECTHQTPICHLAQFGRTILTREHIQLQNVDYSDLAGHWSCAKCNVSNANGKDAGHDMHQTKRWCAEGALSRIESLSRQQTWRPANHRPVTTE